MPIKVLCKMSPYITSWFSENYGRNLIKKYLNKVKNCNTVLDLDAGGGDDLMLCKEKFPRAKLYAVESFPPYAKKLSDMGINVFPLNIEHDALPFEDESIDVIIINQVLEHTKDIYWVLHECSRVLKRGGALIVGTPNLAAWHNRLILSLGIQPPTIATLSCHVRGFTRGDLKEFVMCAGIYSIRSQRSSGFYPFPPGIARILAMVFPSLGWSIHLYAEKDKSYQDGFLYVAREFTETNFFMG